MQTSRKKNERSKSLIRVQQKRKRIKKTTLFYIYCVKVPKVLALKVDFSVDRFFARYSSDTRVKEMKELPQAQTKSVFFYILSRTEDLENFAILKYDFFFIYFVCLPYGFFFLFYRTQVQCENLSVYV